MPLSEQPHDPPTLESAANGLLVRTQRGTTAMGMTELTQVHAEFAKRLGPCVIAGGAVRDTLMDREPKDYDVFVLNNAELPPDWTTALEVVTAPEWHKSEPNLQATIRWEGKIVQVMRTEINSARCLVESFDWNVSLFAYDPRLSDPVLRMSNVLDLAPGKPLRLNKVTFPVSTLRRGFRFSERMGMIFQADELAKLCVLAAGRLMQ